MSDGVPLDHDELVLLMKALERLFRSAETLPTPDGDGRPIRELAAKLDGYAGANAPAVAEAVGAGKRLQATDGVVRSWIRWVDRIATAHELEVAEAEHAATTFPTSGMDAVLVRARNRIADSIATGLS